MSATSCSSESFLYDPAVNICQTIVPSLMAEGQALMINPRLMHHGGVEIMNRNLVAHDGVAKVVGFPVDQAGLEFHPPQ